MQIVIPEYFTRFIGKTAVIMNLLLFVPKFSNINLPVLPAGLQIMADQGFEHQLPVIVIPKGNQQPIPEIMRR